MSFFGLSNRSSIEEALAAGSFTEHQVVESDIGSLQIADKIISRSDFKSVHASALHIDRSTIENTSFTMCDLMSSQFNDCHLTSVVFEGANLIKTHWNSVISENIVIRGSSLQRLSFVNSSFSGSTFTDIEGLYGHVDNCSFIGCTFEIGYGSGMNGFGDTVFNRVLFHNCSFSGFPLRGSQLKFCLFSRCNGEIGDSIEAHDVAGLGHPAFWHHGTQSLSNRQEAEALLDRITSMRPRGRTQL